MRQAEARDVANALAFKQSEVARAESSQFSLHQQLLAKSHQRGAGILRLFWCSAAIDSHCSSVLLRGCAAVTTPPSAS